MSLSWNQLDSRELPQWYKDAKFGIFIHWGVYSVPAYRSVNNELFGSYAEWYYASVYGPYKNNDHTYHRDIWGDNFLYRDFAPLFKAELYDPSYIADVISRCGAKYCVFTSKHHDGYCMWPTINKYKLNWNSNDVGPKRDLLGDLARELVKRDVRLGIYYSIIDWESVPSHRCEGGYFIPSKDRKKFGFSQDIYLQEILKPQLTELVETYKPSLLFFDGGEWDLTEEEVGAREFLTWLYRDSPVCNEIVVNDRLFVEMPSNHGDYYSTEYHDKDIDGHYFEESRGIGKSYGYNKAERLDDYLTAKEIIRELYQVVSHGGNFLLNIGPDSSGTLPLHEVERLEKVGQWLEIAEEAIYETIPSKNTNLCSTRNKSGSKEYVFVPLVGRCIEFEDSAITSGVRLDILGVEEDVCYTLNNGVVRVEIKQLLKAACIYEKFGVLVVRKLVEGYHG